jgi:hypothetical protein
MRQGFAKSDTVRNKQRAQIQYMDAASRANITRAPTRSDLKWHIASFCDRIVTIELAGNPCPNSGPGFTL